MQFFYGEVAILELSILERPEILAGKCTYAPEHLVTIGAGMLTKGKDQSRQLGWLVKGREWISAVTVLLKIPYLCKLLAEGPHHLTLCQKPEEKIQFSFQI